MSSLDLVSVRLTRVALRINGVAPHGPMTTAAVQAALLVDLVLAGAVSNGSVSLYLDTTPTGFAPADRLLLAVAEQPDRPIEWWLRRGPVRMNDSIEVLLEEDVWLRQARIGGRRYRDVAPDEVASERRRVLGALQGRSDAESTAALAVIGTASGQFDFETPFPVDEALASCGSLRWITSDLYDYLKERRAFLSAVSETRQDTGGG